MKRTRCGVSLCAKISNDDRIPSNQLDQQKPACKPPKVVPQPKGIHGKTSPLPPPLLLPALPLAQPLLVPQAQVQLLSQVPHLSPTLALLDLRKSLSV